MQPGELTAASFAHYPPRAREFAITNLPVLRSMPFPLLPVVLRELIDYDWRFPVEQHALAAQFRYLKSLSPAEQQQMMQPFRAIRLPQAMGEIDWVNNPQRFSELLSASLWSTQEIESFREAAFAYQAQVDRATGADKLPAVPRFTLVAIGQGVTKTERPLFRSLRPHGVLFTKVDPTGGLDAIIDFVCRRAQMQPAAYAHWYIDGGAAEPKCGTERGVTAISYAALAPVAARELDVTNAFVARAGQSQVIGPEQVQSFMAALRPSQVGLEGNASDAVQRHFELSVLTQGAGAQVFSTTFVQWSAREALRRAQPLTLMARFAPRQRMAPMEELLHRNPIDQATDSEGSLIDADMGAYYTWINQARLPDAARSRFLAWFEGHQIAVAIAPGLPANTVSDSPARLEQVIQWMT